MFLFVCHVVLTKHPLQRTFTFKTTLATYKSKKNSSCGKLNMQARFKMYLLERYIQQWNQISFKNARNRLMPNFMDRLQAVPFWLVERVRSQRRETGARRNK